MTVPKKLFIAAVILSAGFGLAVLFGPPADPYVPTKSFSGSHRAVDTHALIGQTADGVRNPNTIGSTYLVPEVSHAPETGLAATNARLSMETKANLPERGPVDSPPVDSHPQARLVGVGASPQQLDGYAESRPQVSALPQAGVQASAESAVATVVYPRAVSPEVPSGRDQQEPLALPSPPVLQASFDSPGRSEASGPPALNPIRSDPPAYTAPRTHIIADGDSLPRLAERYLGDPQRGQEIFALNEGVLTHPDLLPIGVELRIPPRSSRSDPSSAWGRGPQGAALESGLVPVYELPVTATVAPRAQLLQPVSPATQAARYQDRAAD